MPRICRSHFQSFYQMVTIAMEKRRESKKCSDFYEISQERCLACMKVISISRFSERATVAMEKYSELDEFSFHGRIESTEGLGDFCIR